MRKFSWMLLVLLAFWAGCQDQPKVQEPSTVEQKSEPVAAEPSEDEPIIIEKPFTTDDPDMRVVISKKDGAKMVWIPGMFEVIPATREIIPTTYDKSGDVVRGEHEIVTPEKMVKVVDAFYMDVHEVTVGQFREFVNQSGYDYPEYWDEVATYSPGNEYPMIYVSWHDATAYAKWAGKRLPFEAEWEYAARGGLKGKEYPWGDQESLARDYANYHGIGGKDKWEYCAPVGSFEANGYGLYDMVGNVWEWCQDWYDSGERTRVLRGGNWFNSTNPLRVAYRSKSAPNFRLYIYGFRCVVSGSDNP